MMDSFFRALDHAHKVQKLAALHRQIRELEIEADAFEQEIINDGPLSCGACRRRSVVICEHVGGV